MFALFVCVIYTHLSVKYESRTNPRQNKSPPVIFPTPDISPPIVFPPGHIPSRSFATQTYPPPVTFSTRTYPLPCVHCSCVMCYENISHASGGGLGKWLGRGGNLLNSTQLDLVFVLFSVKYTNYILFEYIHHTSHAYTVNHIKSNNNQNKIDNKFF